MAGEGAPGRGLFTGLGTVLRSMWLSEPLVVV